MTPDRFVRRNYVGTGNLPGEDEIYRFRTNLVEPTPFDRELWNAVTSQPLPKDSEKYTLLMQAGGVGEDYSDLRLLYYDPSKKTITRVYTYIAQGYIGTYGNRFPADYVPAFRHDYRYHPIVQYVHPILPLIIENALLTESREWILDSSGRRKERDERGFQWLIETSDGVPLEHSVFKPLDKKTFVSINSQQVWCEWSRAIHLIGKGWSDYGCDANRMMVNVQLKNVDNTAVARPYLEGVDIPEVLGWARYARF